LDKRKTMKLRSKTLLLSGLILFTLILALLIVSQVVFLNTYSDYENKYSYHVLKDELSQFNRTISAMDQTTKDWAQWDDAYSFVSGNNPGFVTNNLPPNIFMRLHLNLILFVDNNGNIVYGKAYDLETNQYTNLPKNLSNFTKENPLLQHDSLEGKNGVLNLPEGPMIITTRPIVNSHEQGPIKGTLIMGRYITPNELNLLINTPNSTLSVSGYNDPYKPSDFSKILPSLSNAKPWNLQILGSNSIAAYALINDIYGNPAIILKSEMSRTLYKSYLNTVLYFIISIVMIGLFFVGLILYSLDKNVLNRLDQIMSEIIDIGKKGDLKRRITVFGNDELSDLALSINNTVYALQKSEQNLEESEKNYKSIFENTGTAMIIAEEDMTITLVNKIFENIVKQDKEDIEGKLNWIDILIPEDREKIQEYHRTHEKSNVLDIQPKNYETKVDIDGDVVDLFATFDFIPGTRKSLISLIDITDRKRAEGLLKTSLKEKELLLREIHHRVKNSLQIISSLLSLQSSKLDDEKIIEEYKESENRIHTIALIHESLYQSTDISKIDFKDYVEILVEDIMHSFNADTNLIKTSIEIGDFELGIETAIPLGLIINELISNSLKHAFRHKKGEITIILEKNEDLYTLTVKDNGIGLPDGFNFNNTQSLGFQLVNALVNQLDGELDVEIDNGTTIRIVFKELEYKERI
jgi:PAS domain S-box-containing protein